MDEFESITVPQNSCGSYRVLDCIFYLAFSNTANSVKSYKIMLSGQDNFWVFPSNALVSAQSVTKCQQNSVLRRWAKS